MKTDVLSNSDEIPDFDELFRYIKSHFSGKGKSSDIDFFIIDEIGKVLSQRTGAATPNIQAPDSVAIVKQEIPTLVEAVQRAINRTRKSEKRRGQRFLHIDPENLDGELHTIKLQKVTLPSDKLEDETIKHLPLSVEDIIHNSEVDFIEMQMLHFLREKKEIIDKMDGKGSAAIKELRILNPQITVKEISERTGIPERTVERRLAARRGKISE